MDFVRAVILGVVQGLTEFLPVSSSGHLILVPRLFGWEDQGLAFDVGLHLGTMFAVLAYFWRDWLRMIGVGLVDLSAHGLVFRRHRPPSRLLWLIALGSIPAALVGFFFSDWIEEHVRQPWLVAIMLALMATVMLIAERHGRRTRDTTALGVRDAIFIGIAQACALIPGVSRSGATISMALFRDVNRADAARFAFLLGTPAFVGAAALKLGDLAGGSGHDLWVLAAGLVTSALTGFVVIHYLLRYLQTRTLFPFAVYRYGVAAATLIIAGIRVA